MSSEYDPFQDPDIESDHLQIEFINAYPAWAFKPDALAKISHAFDSYITWRTEAENTGGQLDIRECMKLNEIGDVADDICEFLIARYGIEHIER
ncbi:hypothetical protein KW811_22105 [Enterobacter quasiroggenkampii]|uniref:hypothetical protein n=1 Tax=Enterobacter quasiroggenkampii TaxID=2497436 RepID=UPI0021D00203|nr:hypothetical protein [Enterobacter quasiroggenkampii]MCU6401181.1 hypothetical protein [Enterobacter quasiroggenkampii]